MRRYPHQFSGGSASASRSPARWHRARRSCSPTSRSAPSTYRCARRCSTWSTDLVGELGLTLVFVSHDLSVVRHVCDRVAVMNDGEIVETGTDAADLRNPQHPYTQRLLRAAPSMRRALARGRPRQTSRRRIA